MCEVFCILIYLLMMVCGVGSVFHLISYVRDIQFPGNLVSSVRPK